MPCASPQHCVPVISDFTVSEALQEKVANTQSRDSSPSRASPQQSSELVEMQQGLQDSSAALQAAQSHLGARQEEVLELTQRLEAAQADIASLQVWKAISLHPAPLPALLLFPAPFPPPLPSLPPPPPLLLPPATHMHVTINSCRDEIKRLLKQHPHATL